DTMTPATEAKDRSCDGRKSGGMSDAGAAVEVRVRAERRRPWPDEDKLRIVRETLAPGAVVQAVADRHGISTGQLYTWRKQMLAMAMSGFTPVEVRQEVLPSPADAPCWPLHLLNASEHWSKRKEIDLHRLCTQSTINGVEGTGGVEP
ncbi:MAG TPA: transposase, partial [Roseomonas sp.]